jgi:hypothetical protein
MKSIQNTDPWNEFVWTWGPSVMRFCTQIRQ